MVDSASAQIELLRQEFSRHEERDQDRFGEVREDMKDHGDAITLLREGQANMKGRMTVVGGLAIVLIPVLTEIVHAFFEHPGAGK